MSEEAETRSRLSGVDDPSNVIDATNLARRVPEIATPPPLVEYRTSRAYMTQTSTESMGESAVVIRLSVSLDGASQVAKHKFAESIQNYADRLAQESGRQEISNRAPGATVPEITASSVIKACEVLDTPPSDRRSTLTILESFGLAGAPIFSGAVGAMAGYLNSLLQWTVFLACVALSVFCVLYSLRRRLL